MQKYGSIIFKIIRGIIPKILGIIPKTLGIIPKTLGIIPKTLGIIPGKIWCQAFSDHAWHNENQRNHAVH